MIKKTFCDLFLLCFREIFLSYKILRSTRNISYDSHKNSRSVWVIYCRAPCSIWYIGVLGKVTHTPLSNSIKKASLLTKKLCKQACFCQKILYRLKSVRACVALRCVALRCVALRCVAFYH